jgi:site-specific DNA recombinase
VTSAAIYARVSSARQKKDETIGSQTAALCFGRFISGRR